MIIDDVVYGKHEVNETVVLELIQSDPLQRLNGINQYGFSRKYYHKDSFSRYDHSIGVFLLLRKLNAGLEEQLSGLQHDVSHTVFSHVADFVFGDILRQDYQDNNHGRIIEQSSIPAILTKHRYDSKIICDLNNFCLLDKEIPELCADRVDYFLRELNVEGKDVKDYVSSLRNFNNRIIFNDFDIARSFSKEFLRLQNESWGGLESMMRFHIMAGILKEALKNKVINENDLYTTDQRVLGILENSKNDYIQSHLLLLNRGFDIHESSNGDGFLMKVKFRYVDPEILLNGKLSRLSKMCSDYRESLEESRLKFLNPKRYSYSPK